MCELRTLAENGVRNNNSQKEGNKEEKAIYSGH